MSQSSLVRTPKPSFTYRLVSTLLVFPIFRLLFRGSTAGNNRVPMQGPLVVVANHGSHLDPPLLGHALGRPVAFMAKADLFSIPLLGADSGLWCHPGRGATTAKRSAPGSLPRRRLGHGVFLDGTRQSDGRINAPGAALGGSHGSCFGGHLQQPPRLGQRAQLAALVPIQLRIGDPIQLTVAQ